MFYRTLRLSEETVTQHWDFLRAVFLASAPAGTDNTEKRLADTMQAIMSGRLTVWYTVEYPSQDEINGVPVAVITTSTVNETIANTRWFMIYTVSILKGLEDEVWEQTIEALRKAARAANCSRIVSHITHRAILARALKLGAKEIATMIELEV